MSWREALIVTGAAAAPLVYLKYQSMQFAEQGYYEAAMTADRPVAWLISYFNANAEQVVPFLFALYVALLMLPSPFARKRR